MSRLKVMLRGALISEVELNPEKEYVGGRKEGSDIRLQAEKGISREHFKLKYVEGQWQISAISRFGDVFTGGQKIEEAPLQHGQSFQVPPYEFTFQDVPDAGLPGPESAPVVANVNENDKTVIGAVPQVPYIKMVNSAGAVSEMLRLEVGDVWVAGRDPSCQIIIPDQRVSRRQFEIYKVNGAYTILDLASVNGTFLNGSPVSSTDPQTLKSGDAINVLDNTMYFELHDPNFRYKVEKIEVPPLQMDNFEEEVVPEDYVPPEYVEEGYEQVGEGEEYVEQYDVPQQMVVGDGPFTGMPGAEGQDPNQFYTFQAPPPDAPPPPPPTLIQKITANKPLLIGLVILFLAGAYLLSEMLGGEPAKPVAQNPQQNVDTGDPFSKLSPAQQKEVEELYTLAEQMLNQQKYELALEQIRKLKELLPTGYRESERIEFDAEQAIATMQALRDDEIRRAAEAEQAAKNKQTLEQCEKLLGPNITSDEMLQCLAPVAAMDPMNVDYVRIMKAVEKIETDRRQAEIDAQTYSEKVARMDELYNKAEAEHRKGFAFKTIKRYQDILNSTLPDPKKYKDIARQRIRFIEDKIREKSQGSMAEADDFFKKGKLKEAVITLREAMIYDPQNKSIQEKIDAYSLELTRRMRTIYQESIIDENYGIIDNTEVRQGAKEKWKKITETDLIDGEYYRKAVMKLRRYGVY